MLMRVLLSIFVGIVVGIIVYAVGALMVVAPVTVVASLGAVLKMLSVWIGVAAALWFIVTGRTTLRP